MARIRRYRRYRKKGRWSANIKRISYNENLSVINEGYGFNFITLCQNPPQNDSTVSQQYTVKNIELSLYIEANNYSALTYLEEYTVYIMYVPQGMSVDSSYPMNHPEYIMAYRFYGNSKIEDDNNGLNNISNQQAYPIKVKSRLSRRLQTGDGIIFLITYKSQTNLDTGIKIDYSGLCRWWTKAN